ncbi:RING-H2 finger protein ATL52-like [Arachis ipaensis]|uniref:RING-H2 finger protein ATL52-like n=1 Tax=Arachis ipaensis TaxID=130454 RepID=UPI0007AFA351|nr:RING-H2 finger protein ATL52-like [Arachis ipaensis]
MDNDGGGGQGNPLSNNIVVLLLAMGSAAFVVSIYHLIAICFCNNRQNSNNNEQNLHQQDGGEPSTSTSVAHLIPSHKYHKKKVNENGEEADDCGGSGGTCAVCLGDFEEGEELKTLPECMHSFHVPCIDMWLYSHTSCPVCRASATPSPVGLNHGPLNVFGDHSGYGLNNNNNNARQGIDMVQIAVVQSGFVRR